MAVAAVSVALAGAAAFLAAIGVVFYLNAPRERTAAAFLAERSMRAPARDLLAPVDASAIGRRLAADLAAAGMTTRPSALLMVMLGILAGGVFVLPGMFGEPGYVLAVVIAAIPYVVVRRRAGRHAREFKRQLPAALELMANGLRAGQTEVQVFGLIADEMTGAIKEEFERMHHELDLGATVEGVTASLLERMPDPDLELAVDAIHLAHRVGGDLAQMLADIAGTIRQRVRLALEVGALTAQARGSVYLVTALVPVGLLMISLINPEWGRLLFQTGSGRVLLAIAFTLVGIGYITARRASQVEV